LVQICAKVGGIPWTMSEMPFNDAPTVIINILDGVGTGFPYEISRQAPTLDSRYRSHYE